MDVEKSQRVPLSVFFGILRLTDFFSPNFYPLQFFDFATMDVEKFERIALLALQFRRLGFREFDISSFLTLLCPFAFLSLGYGVDLCRSRLVQYLNGIFTGNPLNLAETLVYWFLLLYAS